MVSPLSSKKALFIDDDDTIIARYSPLLRKEGYGVVIAKNGRDAFEESCQESFDLIITNLAMKAGKGRTVLGMIKTLFPRIPLIVITNDRCAIAQTFIPLLGTCTVIKKPCTGEVFVSCVRNSLAGESTHSRQALEVVEEKYG